MLSDKTIRKLQTLLDCKSDERRIILYAAGLPKTFLNLVDVNGEINKVIMRIAYHIDGWEQGLQEIFEEKIRNSALFKPVEPESKFPKFPILKILVWEGGSSIIGVWGSCSVDLLEQVEKDIQENFCDEEGNLEIMIQITGYSEPEYEGPHMINSGYYFHEEISREKLNPPF